MVTVKTTYKGYRIAISGKLFKIYKAEGGLLTTEKFESVADAKRRIDRQSMNFPQAK